MRPSSKFLQVLAMLLVAASAAAAQSLRFAPVFYRVAPVSATLPSPGQLFNPTGLAVDGFGNLYIADTSHDYVRRVDPSGVATIIAGVGYYGLTGDGGPGTQAALAGPTQIAADPAGNVYIVSVDSIRKVSTSGIISLFAGGNGPGTSGDGGPALSAQVAPASIACDTVGNVYFVDYTSNTVRKIDIFGTITTIAGGGTPASGNGDGGPALQASFTAPAGIAVGPSGKIYIADASTNTVRVITTDGNVATYAGSTYGYSGDGGPALAAQFGSLTSIAADAAENVYVSDQSFKTIRKISNEHLVSTLTGNTSGLTPLDGTLAQNANFSYPSLHGPSGVAADAQGNVYLSVGGNNAVYQVVQHPEVFPQTRIGNTTPTQRLIVQNTGASAINLSAVSVTGDFSIGTSGTSSASTATPCTATTQLQAGISNSFCTIDVQFKPTAEGIRSFPVTITSNDTPTTTTQTVTSTGLGSALAMNSGQMVIVAGNRALALGSAPPSRVDNIPATAARLSGETNIAVSSAGDIYLTDEVYCQILKVDGATGIINPFAGMQVASNACGATFSTGDDGDAKFAILSGVGFLALDASNNLYVTSVFDGSIRKIDSKTSKITTIAGTGHNVFPVTECGYTGDGGPANLARLCQPRAMTFDGGGNMYFSDSGNNVIRKIDITGTISTVAGVRSTSGSYSGDGGSALSAHLNGPNGIAVNSTGDLFFVDETNLIVRRVSAASGLITTFAGQHGVSGFSGDGGPATSATFGDPKGLSIDAAGNVFIADSTNMVVRKVDTNGIITTIAGDHSSYDNYNGDDLLATDTYLAFPSEVKVNAAGHIFVTDTSNFVIREISPNGTVNFPLQKVGTLSRLVPVTVNNVGNMPMHFDALYPTGISGDFSLASNGNCDFTQPLAVGGSCTVQIGFTPTAEGPRLGIFAFYDDGVATPQYVSLIGTGVIPKNQTISFKSLPNVTYGVAGIPLTGTSDSTLTLKYRVVSGNAATDGSKLYINGIGAVTVEASQDGNDYFNAATPVTQTFTVLPAALTVTANDISVYFGDALPPLAYTVTGFVNGDTQAVLTGSATLTCGVFAASGALGSYPITFTSNTLAAANYTLISAPGTYSVTQLSQTITSFTTVGDQIFGTGDIPVRATADSGLPVTVSVVSGPATFSGGLLTLTGTGTVTIAADQPGNGKYAAAPELTQTFSVHIQAILSWRPTTNTVYTGNTLGAGFLNATVDQHGTLVYTAAVGGIPSTLTTSTLLPAGRYFVSANFTPTDTVNVLPASSFMVLVVQNQSIFFVDGSGTTGSFDNTGAPQSSGTTGGGKGASVDSSGRVWSLNTTGDGLTSFTDTGGHGSVVSGSGIHGATAFTIDGSGILWVTNSDGTISTAPTHTAGGAPVNRLSDAPAFLRPAASTTPISAGGTISGATSIAVDASGSLWVTSATDNSVTEVLGAASPVATPLVNAVANNTLGARP